MPNTDNSAACLLLHGYLGSPLEMEPLVRPLRDLGLDVRLPTLPGHDSTLAEFKRNNFDTWSRFIEAEYDKALAERGRVIVIGLSLGGTFALHLGECRKPAAIVAIDTPVFPPSSSLRQLWGWLRLFCDPVRALVGTSTFKPWSAESNAISPWRGYDKVFHITQIFNMFRGFNRTRQNLGRISAPILIMHDVRDEVVTSDNALAVMRGVASENCRLEMTKILENVTIHHILTTHEETGSFVINRIRTFVCAVCGLPQPALWLENENRDSKC